LKGLIYGIRTEAWTRQSLCEQEQDQITPGKTSAGEHWFRVKVGKPKQAKPAVAAPVAQVSEDSDIPF